MKQLYKPIAGNKIGSVSNTDNKDIVEWRKRKQRDENTINSLIQKVKLKQNLTQEETLWMCDKMKELLILVEKYQFE